MIQRKQTLYLLAVAILMATMLFLPLTTVVFSDTPGTTTDSTSLAITKTTVLGSKTLVLNACGVYRDTKQEIPLIYLTALICIVAAASLVNIFLYKRRKLQQKICIAIALCVVSVIVFAAIYVNDLVQLAALSEGATIKYSVSMVFPLLSLTCLWLAYSGIKKDIELVRSLDRIR